MIKLNYTVAQTESKQGKYNYNLNPSKANTLLSVEIQFIIVTRNLQIKAAHLFHCLRIQNQFTEII